jgi:hypothetical protein
VDEFIENDKRFNQFLKAHDSAGEEEQRGQRRRREKALIRANQLHGKEISPYDLDPINRCRQFLHRGASSNRKKAEASSSSPCFERKDKFLSSQAEASQESPTAESRGSAVPPAPRFAESRWKRPRK